MRRFIIYVGLMLVLLGVPATVADHQPKADVLIKNGMIYDGLGGKPYAGGVAIRKDKIVAVGNVDHWVSDTVLDAGGHAIAPGFINMLSWGNQSLIVDGRAMSDIAQGITLEVMGEGNSMGPVTPETARFYEQKYSGDFPFEVKWQSLGEYLEYLTAKGVTPNVASFVGATTVRLNQLGAADVDPTAEQLTAMRADVADAMEDGAMGVGSALIYAPAFYAKSPELIALAAEAAKYGGSYITHLRSEGDRFEESIDELVLIGKLSGAAVEIYHLKAAGKANWPKLARVIDRIQSLRDEGMDIRANMYSYTAGATGLDAAMPPWVQAGGYDAWKKRLQNPRIRARVKAEMQAPVGWESLMVAAASPDRMILSGFVNPALKKYTGRTLADVMQERGTDAEDTVIDLVIEDGSRVGTIYYLMSDDNIARKIKTPWISFGSDGEAPAPEGAFLKSNPHPRAYGNVARVLGRYVRDEKLIPLEQAIMRLTSLPAQNLKIRSRGQLAKGYKADVVIFDPATISDKATFARPHQLAVGVRHVFVNGTHVWRDGKHTGATPGEVVRGPGWRGWQQP